MTPGRSRLPAQIAFQQRGLIRSDQTPVFFCGDNHRSWNHARNNPSVFAKSASQICGAFGPAHGLTYSTSPNSGVSRVSNCFRGRYFGTDPLPTNSDVTPGSRSIMVRTLIPCAQRVVTLVAVSVSIAAAQSTPRTTPATQRAAPAVPKMPMMASVDSALLRGLNYRLVGHSRGGRVTTVTGVPSQPRTFYMGVASGGLFRTTDGGLNWEPITDGKVPVASMGSVEVALTDPNIIYLGTGSDGVRSNVSTGRGVYKTLDGGKTWSFIGLYNAGQIGALRIHPTDPNTVWVAAYGDIFKPNNDRGVFKTTDGGRTWRKTLYMNDSTGAMDVELQPGNPNVVYAWMNRIERKPWSIISGSREGGM